MKNHIDSQSEFDCWCDELDYFPSGDDALGQESAGIYETHSISRSVLYDEGIERYLEERVSEEMDRLNRLREEAKIKPPSRSYRFAAELVSTHIFLVCNETLYQYQREFNCYEIIPHSKIESLVVQRFSERTHSMTSHQFDEVVRWLYRLSRICEADDFNAAEKYGINCLNGVVEIEDGQISLRPHRTTDLFSYCIRANFIFQDDDMPVFESFCQSSLEGDEQKRKLLLQHIGYILSDNMSAKKALCWVGKPHSGKSVLERLLTRLVTQEMVSNVDLHELSNQFERANLHMRKVNISPDASSRAMSSVNHFKAAIGMDRITGAYKHKCSFSFFCRAKLLISSNTLISSREYDPTSSFIDRLSIIRFNWSIPVEEQNKNLEEDMWQEVDAIFTNAIHAFVDFLMDNSTLIQLEESTALIESVLSDQPTQEFINSMLEAGDDLYLYRFQMEATYEEFCRYHNYDTGHWEKLKSEILTAFPKAKYKKLHRLETPGERNSARLNRKGFVGIAFKVIK